MGSIALLLALIAFIYYWLLTVDENRNWVAGFGIATAVTIFLHIWEYEDEGETFELQEGLVNPGSATLYGSGGIL